MSSDQSIYCLAWLMVDIPMVLWKTSDNKYSVHLIHTKSLSLFSFSKLEIKADRSIELTDDHTCKNRLNEEWIKAACLWHSHFYSQCYRTGQRRLERLFLWTLTLASSCSQAPDPLWLCFLIFRLLLKPGSLPRSFLALKCSNSKVPVC